jgi:hypothetical protein
MQHVDVAQTSSGVECDYQCPYELSIAMPLNKWQSLCPMGRLIFMHPVGDFILDSAVSSLNTTIGF